MTSVDFSLSQELRQALQLHGHQETGYFVYDLDKLHSHLTFLSKQNVVRRSD